MVEILKYNPGGCLPTARDLPDSDDTPVDNELQDLIPGFLKLCLAAIWSKRLDWFFGVDMGIYYHPNLAAVVPDGFLAVGVPRIIDSDLRLSYVLWEEQQVPLLALEVVSHQRRGEYSTKKRLYAEMGVLYYVIYNPLRKNRPRMEVYRLEDGQYQPLPGEPFWLAEIDLGIGRGSGTYQGIHREWLYWFDEQGKRCPTPEEIAQQAQQERRLAEERSQQAEEQRRLAEEKAERLAARLRELGIDPDTV
ncbi:MAG: hypothetical protein HC890_20325 [Chloroflexaceae bacterium]|nr:hypothetical protein [Chloroflexaceae bacterium]